MFSEVSNCDGMIGLITPEEEEKLLKKILEYYKKLYPGVDFIIEEKILTKEEIGELLYTYAGEENEATAQEKMRLISSAITHGYKTPIIVLAKNNKLILLDGHRRVKVAYKEGLDWAAYVIKPKKELEFGIEAMIMGRVKDLYS
ncbi:MAG: hypothetical protein QXF35_01210 [Candidatus Bilamarchaeaceae archaeon]